MIVIERHVDADNGFRGPERLIEQDANFAPHIGFDVFLERHARVRAGQGFVFGRIRRQGNAALIDDGDR